MRSTYRRTLAVLATTLLALPPAMARAAGVDADQALAQAAIGWLNNAGSAWSNGRWVDLTLVAPPAYQWASSAVSYGPPSELSPVQPTGLESLLGVNCAQPGSPEATATLSFAAMTRRTSTMTVTEGVTVSQGLTVSASVPSWGTGVSETTSVSLSLSESNSTSVSVSYTYTFQLALPLEPGTMQYGTLVVDFQQIAIPWAANVQYIGGDQIRDVGQTNFPWPRDPEPEGYANWYNRQQQPMRSTLAPAQQTYQAAGTFTGSNAGTGTAVAEPVVQMTEADRAEYCPAGLESLRARPSLRSDRGDIKVVRVPLRRPEVRR